MAEAIPLMSCDGARPVAYFRGAPIDGAQLRAAVLRLAAQLPAASHVVNLCANRYCFLLAWLAACLRRQLVLLPSDQSPGTLAQLATGYAGLQTLDDDLVESLLTAKAVSTEAYEWSLPADHVVAIAFTSGSTGKPQAHPKRWRTLARNAQIAAKEVLGGAGANIVATVPPQHAYGLETSVISVMSAGCTLHDGRPFFPHDVKAALESVPEPRTLVTTPTHLKSLHAARMQLPALQAVVSATAPLALDLASEIELAWSTVVHEIYGCTEAGIVAWRRTTQTERWRTFEGGRVFNDERGAWYAAPQFADDIALQDVIEPISEREFHLRGRAGDMIKVAGKRASLAGLTEQVRCLAGVLDAVVFVPAVDARPAALVVAPGLRAQDVLRALSERIDPVFLPRPLVCVDELPRNASGKLPFEALLRALASGGRP